MSLRRPDVRRVGLTALPSAAGRSSLVQNEKVSGGLLSPSPPAEHAERSKHQAGQSCTDGGAGDGKRHAGGLAGSQQKGMLLTIESSLSHNLPRIVDVIRKIERPALTGEI